MSRTIPTHDEVMAILHEVPDPEVPAISVVDLGIIRGVELAEEQVTVLVTPTYSGCPAMRVIEQDVVAALAAQGIPAAVRTVFSPPWTTDWISEEGRRKLKEYGIAPPGAVPAEDVLVPLLRRGDPEPARTPCPFCDSTDTQLRSTFGSTACKALGYCNACRQPFEIFKAI